MAISEEQVKHVAKLAKLSFSENEIHSFTEGLGEIIDMVEALSEVNTEGVPVTTNVFHDTSVMREDKVIQEDSLELLMRNAPDSENGYIRVPVIIENGEAGA